MPQAITYKNFGDPEAALELSEERLPDLQANEVQVKMLSAPINPVDINIIEGRYPIDVRFPQVGGKEGAGIIEILGEKVTDFSKGQIVMAPNRLGTWCENFICSAEELIAIPTGLDPVQAGMQAINLPTAWKMMQDFASLNPGDWLVQNGANSAVGQIVIQMAKAKGIKTINLVRREELIKELKSIGADEVLVMEDKISKKIKEITSGKNVKLGLNCVGRKSAGELAKCLSPSGTLVTYGAMGKEPFQVGNALMIFKDIRFVGFNITQWCLGAKKDELRLMFKEVLNFVLKHNIKVKIEKTYKLPAYKEAIQHAIQGERKGKIVFEM
jgi:NADPH:quinone reductase-like Zn-dependent oxidoreductase